MSYLFEVEGESVWFPALAVGTAYVGAIRGLEAGLRMDAGFEQYTNDMVKIDRREFSKFVKSLVEQAERQSSPAALHDLMCAVVPPALVMLERTGTVLPVDQSMWAERVAEVRAEMPR